MRLTTIAVIQARTGSTRLPGKVMYPLDGCPVLEHVVRRTAHAERVDTVVVATSTEDPDDVIAEYAPRFGAELVRGSESNVLSRFETVVDEYAPDIILRVTGDCPLIEPRIIDSVAASVMQGSADYATNVLQRTFPRGLDVEAFSAESFRKVISAATTQKEREHVTPYYREHPDEFDLVNIRSNDVFQDERYINRTDLRLTLDEPDDYRLLEQIYRTIEFDEILPIWDAIDLVDEEGLASLNESVSQKEP